MIFGILVMVFSLSPFVIGGLIKLNECWTKNYMPIDRCKLYKQVIDVRYDISHNLVAENAVYKIYSTTSYGLRFYLKLTKYGKEILEGDKRPNIQYLYEWRVCKGYGTPFETEEEANKIIFMIKHTPNAFMSITKN